MEAHEVSPNRDVFDVRFEVNGVWLRSNPGRNEPCAKRPSPKPLRSFQFLNFLDLGLEAQRMSEKLYDLPAARTLVGVSSPTSRRLLMPSDAKDGTTTASIKQGRLLDSLGVRGGITTSSGSFLTIGSGSLEDMCTSTTTVSSKVDSQLFSTWLSVPGIISPSPEELGVF
jgi:hypothetical protein